jgi:hypothetical protein
MPCSALQLVSMIRITISLAETSEYYHVRHPLRICLQQIYLHALTGTSVGGVDHAPTRSARKEDRLVPRLALRRDGFGPEHR